MKKSEKNLLLLVLGGVIFINVFCDVLYLFNYKTGIIFLLCSQFSFLTLLTVCYYKVRKKLQCFFQSLLLKMDQMINRELIDTQEITNDTYISQVYHSLNKLYDLLLTEQATAKSEKNKLQAFISDISHQIKAPITNLKLIQDTLYQSEDLENNIKDNILLQKRQIEKLEFLIQALIKTSQLENGIIQLHPEISSINESIISALENVLIMADRKQIDIHFDNLIEYKFIFDRKWTGEAIFNILDNAVKYTPQGGHITISLLKTNNYIKIGIQDTGIGISRNDLDNIFRRFWRGNTNVAEGNGIGLYLCKKIVTLQDGYILVNSVLQKGTQFELFLPNK